VNDPDEALFTVTDGDRANMMNFRVRRMPPFVMASVSVATYLSYHRFPEGVESDPRFLALEDGDHLAALGPDGPVTVFKLLLRPLTEAERPSPPDASAAYRRWTNLR